MRLALAAHPQVIVAVEVRDPELLTPELARVLKAQGCTYCLGLHGKMPPIEAQLPLLRALWPGPLVCRWSLNRCFGAYGYQDAQKKHDPFNEIRSEDLHTRSVLATTIAGITGAGQPAFVTISNDAEGCAPRSIALLAQALVAGQPQPAPDSVAGAAPTHAPSPVPHYLRRHCGCGPPRSRRQNQLCEADRSPSVGHFFATDLPCGRA